MLIRNENTLFEYQLRINRVINYININLDQQLPLEKFSEVANFSPFHFHRIFHACIGETISQFVSRLRIQKAAKELLFSRKKTITQIGIDCGFSSSQNFSRAFNKHFNMAPSAFRKTLAPYGHNSDHVLMSSPLFNKKIKASIPISDVTVKEMPNYKVAYERLIGEYNPKKIRPLFNRMIRWAEARSLLNDQSKIIGVSWDIETIAPDGRVRFDACLSLPDGYYTKNIHTQIISGGKYAVYHCEFNGFDFKTPWNDFIREWLPYSGYQPDDKPYYEIYYTNGFEDPDQKWIVDFCMPVRPL